MANKQELLKPRYMSKIHDPFCRFARGHIFTPSDEKDEKWFENHSFIKLKWWEARRIVDMPQYLSSTKCTTYKTEPLCESGIIRNITHKATPVHKVKEYITTGFVSEDDEVMYFDFEGSMPSTKEEYDAYRKLHT